MDDAEHLDGTARFDGVARFDGAERFDGADLAEGTQPTGHADDSTSTSTSSVGVDIPVSAATLASYFQRPDNGHKYSFGHVLVIGGGPHTPGAPLMSATASLRIGAGLATVATPDPLAHVKGMDELMYIELATDPDVAATQVLEYIRERRVSALVIGPGLDQAYTGIVETVLGESQLPAVVDSGAFPPFADAPDALTALAKHNPSLILTPHAGEFAKLSGLATPESDNTKVTQAKGFATAHGVTLIYKDHRTIIATSDGSVTRNATGNAGMATAGTGDVLTGMIAGLLAQHFSAIDAARFGVYIHGYAGDLAAAELTQPAMVATDLIAYLPTALKLLQGSV